MSETALRPRTVAVDPRRLREFLRPSFNNPSSSPSGVLSFDISSNAGDNEATDVGATTTVGRLLTTAGSARLSARPNLYQRSTCRAELKAFTDNTRCGICISTEAVPVAQPPPKELWANRRTDIPDAIKDAVHDTKNGDNGGGRLMCTGPRVFHGRVLLGAVTRAPPSSSNNTDATTVSVGVMHPSKRRAMLDDEVMGRIARQQMHYARTTLQALEKNVARTNHTPPNPLMTLSVPRAHTAPSCKARDAILGVGLPLTQPPTFHHKGASVRKPKDTLRLCDM